MSASAAPLRVVRPVRARRGASLRLVRRGQSLTVRPATLEDVDAIHALIVAHVAEGHLLPRTRDEVALHIGRFVLAADGHQIVACADLAPLSHAVAEVRSLVVSDMVRGRGIGRQLVDELVRRATTAGFEKLCAFAHAPGFFVAMGFSIVPHVWLPEKITTDCRNCPAFRQCGQYAVMRTLGRASHSCVPLASLHV